MTKNILAVDDDPDILTLIRYNLEKEGYKVFTAESGEAALEKARKSKADLLILDLMMPGMDGLEVCRILKSDAATRGIPVMMLTAKSEETDIVVGLELGGDDYLTKPFSPKVLAARVRALLRRGENTVLPGARLSFGPISVDPERHEVLVDAKPLSLTVTEFNLLKCFVSRPGKVFSREALLNQAWPDDAMVVDRAVDVHILGLRKKMGKYADWIETVRGMGYRLKAEENLRDGDEP